MHDRELGDRKAGMACAECRRSRIKCDRVFPCQSCIRRGCIGCPKGTLAAVKGNVFIATQAKRLENDVESYQARINELEAALKAKTGGSHPALHQNTLAAQDEPQLYTESNLDAVSDVLGSLSIGPDSRAKYHGGSAASEYLLSLMDSPDNEHSWDNDDPTSTCHTVSPEICELSRAFPMGLSNCPYSTVHLIQYLPSEAKALELVDIYYCNGAPKLNPIIRSDLMDSIVKPIYGLAGTASIYTIHAHQLSVFFAVLAAGELPDEESVQPTPLARHYYMLSRAAFSLETIAREANVASVQALLIIMWYLRLSDPKSHEERWLLGGLCVKLSQAIGLQRDSAAWTCDEDEVERRRVLFWELFSYEAWLSMTTGRPPSMSIQHTNCLFPRDREPFLNSSGNFEAGFHYWKLRYAATCLTLSLQHVFCATPPSYSNLINIDKELRRSPIPEHLRCPVDASDADCFWSTNPAKALQQYCVSNVHECNILYIHRSYFAQAMRAEPLDPLQHKYAFSVRAVYTSARRLILGMQGLCFYHRSAARRQWFLWSSMFSGCIVLGALVIESTGCPLARDALSALELAGELFETTFGNARSPTITETLQRLLKRARDVMAAYLSNKPPPAHPPHRCGASSFKPDELAVLGGRRSVITSRALSSTAPPKPNVASSSHSQLDTAAYTAVDSRHDLGSGERVDTTALVFDAMHNYHAQREEPVLNSLYLDPEQPAAHIHYPHQEPPPPQNLNDIWGSYMSALMAPPNSS